MEPTTDATTTGQITAAEVLREAAECLPDGLVEVESIMLAKATDTHYVGRVYQRDVAEYVPMHVHLH